MMSVATITSTSPVDSTNCRVSARPGICLALEAAWRFRMALHRITTTIRNVRTFVYICLALDDLLANSETRVLTRR